MTRRAATLTATAGCMAALAVGLTPAINRPAFAGGNAQRVANQPNIVLILTDDQRIGTERVERTVVNQILRKGTSYEGVVPVSLCAPSRTALLTGRMAHETGVYSNDEATHGGWTGLQPYENQTIATALKSAGYHTILVGKYTNGFWPAQPYVPPGWDTFLAPSHVGYYNYDLIGSQPTESYADTPADYSTDVFALHAVQAIKDAPTDQPLFLYFSPNAPHLPLPRGVAMRYRHARVPPLPWNASMNERDVTDKPPYVRHYDLVERAAMNRTYKNIERSLLAVDDAVRQILTALGPERVANTLFIYMGDNGFQLGDHRLLYKDSPYLMSTRVPLIIRWDGHSAAGATTGMGANVDVTQTILDAAGVPTALATDGHSLIGWHRPALLLEGAYRSVGPPYCGVLTDRGMYVQQGKFQELYVFANDPFEISNAARAAKYHNLLTNYRARAMRACSPTPPGFSWTR